MSECVWSHVKCLKKDSKLFEDMGYITEVQAEGPTWVDLVDESANYGHYDALLALKGKGIPFLAWSDAKIGQFGFALYASDGEIVLEHSSDADEHPTVTVCDDGSVSEMELVHAQEYTRLAKRVRELLGIKEKC